MAMPFGDIKLAQFTSHDAALQSSALDFGLNDGK